MKTLRSLSPSNGFSPELNVIRDSNFEINVVSRRVAKKFFFFFLGGGADS